MASNLLYSTNFHEFCQILQQNSTDYPRRTSSAMDWSGLHMEITIPKSGIPPSNKSESLGLLVAVGNPGEWASNGYLVPAGTNTGVSVRPTYSYGTENINSLDVDERMCIFDDELHKKINNEQVMTLPLPMDKYYVGNCYSECRQRHMIKFCNCTIDYFYPTGVLSIYVQNHEREINLKMMTRKLNLFIFCSFRSAANLYVPTGNYTRCRMSGVKCLNKYDSKF